MSSCYDFFGFHIETPATYRNIYLLTFIKECDEGKIKYVDNVLQF